MKRKTQWGTVMTEQAPTRWKPNKNNGRGEFKKNANKIDNSLKYQNMCIWYKNLCVKNIYQFLLLISTKNNTGENCLNS